MFSILRYVISHGRYFASRFVSDQRGITTIEYGILAAGLAIIITVLVQDGGEFDRALEKIFTNILGNLPSSGDSNTTPAQ
jgi:pilus assembly protein Flp/PilA